MNAVEFVDAVRTEVRDAASQGVISLLEKPPGRRPAADLAALSSWFNALSVTERQYVHEIAAMVSDQATFGFLAVLDGVRVIESSNERGILELRYVRGEENVLINDPKEALLHDLL